MEITTVRRHQNSISLQSEAGQIFAACNCAVQPGKSLTISVEVVNAALLDCREDETANAVYAFIVDSLKDAKSCGIPLPVLESEEADE